MAWTHVALYVGMFVLNSLLEEDDTESLGTNTDFGEASLASEGDTIPIIMGRVRVDNLAMFLVKQETYSNEEDSSESTFLSTSWQGANVVGSGGDFISDGISWIGDAVSDLLGTSEDGSDAPSIPAGVDFFVEGYFALGQVTEKVTSYKGLARIWYHSFADTKVKRPPYTYNTDFNGTSSYITSGTCYSGISGVGGEITLYNGDTGQTEDTDAQAWTEVHTSSASEASASSYRVGGMPGIMYLKLHADAFQYLKGFWIGKSNRLPKISAEVFSIPNPAGINYATFYPSGEDLGSSGSHMDANPVTALYVLLTEDWIGGGLDPAHIDTTSFNDAIDTVGLEYQGFSMLITGSQSIGDIVKIILQQIDAILFVDPVTNLVTIKLLRADYGTYPYAGLPTVDESNLVSHPVVSSNSASDLIESVTVTYQDRRKAYAPSAQTVRNFSVETGNNVTLDLPGVKMWYNARAIANRILTQRSTRTLSVALQVNSDAFTWKPGDVILWSSELNSVENMALRILKITPPDDFSGVYSVQCVQDIFATPALTDTETRTPWVPEMYLAPPRAQGTVMLSMPPGFERQQKNGIGMYGSTPSFEQPVMLAGMTEPVSSRSFSSISNPSISQPKQYSKATSEAPVVPMGTVSTFYNPLSQYHDTSTGLQVNISSEYLTSPGEQGVRDGKGLILVNDELMAYEGYTDLGGGEVLLHNMWRGLYDTTPATKPTGAQVFFLDHAELEKNVSSLVFAEKPDTKLISRVKVQTPSGTLSSSQQPSSHLVLNRRAQRAISPNQFTLSAEGSDTIGTASEISYAYDKDDNKAVYLSKREGNADVSSTDDLGYVFTNDFLAEYARRKTRADTIIRGDDPDEAPAPGDNVSYVFETDDQVVANVCQVNEKGDAITKQYAFVSLAPLNVGTHSLKLCAYTPALDTGELLASLNPESISMTLVGPRQLLLNRKLRDYWKLSAGAPVLSTGYVKEVIGGDGRYARGWENDGVYPHFEVSSDALEQVDTFVAKGHTGLDSEISQVVSVPYLDTLGSSVLLSYFSRYSGGAYPIVNVSSTNALGTQNFSTPAPSVLFGSTGWYEYDQLVEYIDKETTALQVTATLAAGCDALSNLSLRMSPKIIVDSLLNNDFTGAPITNWTQTTGAWTRVTTQSGVTSPVAHASHWGLLKAPTTGTTGLIEQSIGIPDHMAPGDWILLNIATSNYAASGTFTLTLEAKDGASVIDSSVYGPYSEDDQGWRFHEVWLKVPSGSITDVNLKIQVDGDSGMNLLFWSPRVTFMKEAPTYTNYDFSQIPVQALPTTSTEFLSLIPQEGVLPTHLFVSGPEGFVDTPSGKSFEIAYGTEGDDVRYDGPSRGTTPSVQLANSDTGLRCHDTNLGNPAGKSFGFYIILRKTNRDPAAIYNILAKLPEDELSEDTSGYQLYMDAGDLVFNAQYLNTDEGIDVDTSVSIPAPSGEGDFWVYVSHNTTTETLAIASAYDSDSAAVPLLVLSNDKEFLTIGKDEYLDGASTRSDGPSSPLCISLLAFLSEDAAEEYTPSGLWQLGSPEFENTFNQNRVGPICFPTSATEAGDFQQGDHPYMYHSGIYSNEDSVALPSFASIQNLMSYSEDLDSILWVPSGTNTVTTLSEISPRGLKEATMFTLNETGYLTKEITGLTASTEYTVSVYVSAADGSTWNGSLQALEADGITWLSTETLNHTVTGEWRRVSLRFTTAAGETSAYVRLFASHAPPFNPTSMRVWGWMVQEGTNLGPIVLNYGATLESSPELTYDLDLTAEETTSVQEGAVCAGYLIAGDPDTTRGVLDLTNGIDDNDRRLLTLDATAGRFQVYNGTGVSAGHTAALSDASPGLEVKRFGKWNAKRNLWHGSTAILSPAMGFYSIADVQISTSGPIENTIGPGTFTFASGHTKCYIGCTSSGNPLNGVVSYVRLYKGEPRDLNL